MWRSRGWARIRRAQRAMAASGFDALLLTTGANLLYFSGYPSLELTLARPFFMVVPRSGEPILIVHAGRQAEARRFSWVDDVRSYEQLSVAPVAALRRAFIDRDVARGRIGAELGFEQRLGIPVLEFERIREAVPQASFEDAASVLWGLRVIKADWEVDAARRACRITGDAYASTLAAAHGGMRDRDAARMLEVAMTDRGGQSPWVMVASGTGNYELATGSPLDRSLERGDMLWFDAGCRVDGFWSDFSRAGVVGGPTAAQSEMQHAITALTAQGVAMVRPGVPVAEIASHLDEGVRKLGGAVIARTSELAGRVGHGIGFDATEPPHLSATDPTVLAAGMIISIEPGVATLDGLFHVEENVLVTRSGSERLSVAPTGLAVLSSSG